jgi:hypothetical protein
VWGYQEPPLKQSSAPSREENTKLDINAETATLAAATIAAIASLVGLGISTRAQWKAEHRIALRAIIQRDLSEVGQALHETMALSNLQLKDISDEIHKKRYKDAAEAAGKLKNVRLKVRYSLWGLDHGFRELTRLPDWIGHSRRSPNDAIRIFNLADSLCKALDGSVRKAYLRGQPPCLVERKIVDYRTWRLRRCYEKFQKRSKENVNQPGTSTEALQ